MSNRPKPKPRSFVASRDGREALFQTFENCVQPDMVPSGWIFKRFATGRENRCGKCPRVHAVGPCPNGDPYPIAAGGGVYE